MRGGAKCDEGRRRRGAGTREDVPAAHYISVSYNVKRVPEPHIHTAPSGPDKLRLFGSQVPEGREGKMRDRVRELKRSGRLIVLVQILQDRGCVLWRPSFRSVKGGLARLSQNEIPTRRKWNETYCI